jgi:hypothetical protein
MHKKIVLLIFIFTFSQGTQAQNSRGMTMDEYEKAKTFVIKNLDNDTYVKFDNNTYVLDRYEGKKPYFIKGDDSLKKRIDLYTLISKTDQKELGTIIYYTNEKGKLYVACLPNNFTDRKVWAKYFEDIHATDKEEKNYVLKLSYVLSLEYSYQNYKSSLKGKEPDRSEAGTYGMDICFPGTEVITMADGSKKQLTEVKPGEEVLSVDPVTHQSIKVKVNGLIAHEEKNYAITHLTLIRATDIESIKCHEIILSVQELDATTNHPMMTENGTKNIGAIKEGENVLCLNEKTGLYQPYTIWDKTEKAGGLQKVYNIEAAAGQTFVINGVMVMQKAK